MSGYEDNAVLKLVFFLAGAYIMLALTWATFMIVNTTGDNFNIYIIPYISLPHLSQIGSHWWTVFIYGLFHVPNSFMNMLTNMLWLYTFGSVVQMLVGRKQVVPVFLYSMVAGGIFYMLAQLLPGEMGKCPPYVVGPRAGLVGMCVAAYTLSPKYRFWFSETFSLPIAVVAGVFAVLMLLGTGYWVPVMAMIAGGGLMGFIYVRLLRAGYRPGEWMYDAGDWLTGLVTPANEKITKNQRGTKWPEQQMHTRREAEQRIDAILDKMNQKGFDALSSEEREILKKAAQD